MSTKGSFIICIKGADKEVYVNSDAYPSGAGVDVIELIKTCNLDILYDCIREFDEDDEEAVAALGDQEPEFFAYDLLKEAAMEQKTIYTRPSERYFIQNSLFCEYGYVIDLDEDELQFYVGGQHASQDGNRYGNVPMTSFGSNELYYPCHLKAVFTLDYIRATDTERIVLEMQSYRNIKGNSVYRGVKENTLHYVDQTNFVKQKAAIAEQIERYAQRLIRAAEAVPDTCPRSLKRVRELEYEAYKTGAAIATLEKKIKLIRGII